MAHLRVQQVQAVFQAHAFDLRVGGGVKLRPLAAVGEVDGIHVLHQFYGLLLADMLIKRAAELIGDVVFAVRKGAGAAETAHNAAGFAADAGLYLLAVDGAAAFVERLSQLQHGDFQTAPGVRKLISGKDTPGPGADDDNVIIQNKTLLIQR